MNEQQRMQLARADHAERLLTDPLMVEVLGSLKDGIRAQVFDLPMDAVDQRDRLVLMDKCRQQFVNALELMIRGGEMTRYELLAEEHTAARINSIKDRVRNHA